MPDVVRSDAQTDKWTGGSTDRRTVDRIGLTIGLTLGDAGIMGTTNIE